MYNNVTRGERKEEKRDGFRFFFFFLRVETGTRKRVFREFIGCDVREDVTEEIQVCASVHHREIQRNVDHGNLFFFSLCLINHSHNYIVRRSHIVLVFISRCLHHASSVTKNGSVLKKKETLNFLNFVSMKNIIHFLLGRCKLTCRKREKKEKK